MHAKRNLIIMISLAFGVGIVLLFSACGDEQAECELPDDAAACVGDSIVTKDQVAKRIDSLRKVYGPMVADEDADGDGVLDEEFTDLRREVTKQLVREELQFQEEDRRGIVVTEEEIDEYLVAYADDSFLGDYDAMIADFEEKGITVEDLREQADRDLGFIKLEEDLRKDIDVTDEDALEYYHENESQYVQPDRISVRQLITEDEATAAEAVKRIRGGEQFIDVVTDLSIDPEKQDKRGNLGLVSAGTLAPELDAVAFDLEIGAISEPIQVGNNWYVITVESKVPGYSYSFEEKKEEIKFLYGNQQYVEKYKAMIEELLDATPIKYNPDYDPDVVEEDEEGQDGSQVPGGEVPAPGIDAGGVPDTSVEVEVPQS